MPVVPQQIDSISQLHRLLGLPKPQHPMVSLVHNCNVRLVKDQFPTTLLLNFYKISFIQDMRGKVKYGQSFYDFEEGGMVFVAPGQLLTTSPDADEYEGFNIFVHPDFFRGYPLAASIEKYHFFTYAANEALHLSDKERKTILALFRIIEDELQSNIDDSSQDVIISQIELLLSYSNRFYKRQFTTRKVMNNDLLAKLEQVLDTYLDKDMALAKGLPTVQYLAEQLHVSPHYLSDMLRTQTGQNAQQLIHHKIIERAKVLLSNTTLTVAEVAYQLGFEYPQSFNKLFKQKTRVSPLEFRKSFN
ncbi:transcriptional regulator, AraC family [Niastella koreensis GR20-10]|uniref:Transcriptional regulator, AraC family n=2 Tax=Niastella koreensis TaxID=354356 RepID=G8TFP9_NIAKG|nr:transcriptional regulator, AraC family [Niastella koreensis GR20-10]